MTPDALLPLAERFGVFPVSLTGDRRKAPAYSVGTAHNMVRHEPTGESRLRDWFSQPDAEGVAVWCGTLQCIDFDDPDVFSPWLDLIEEEGFGHVLDAAAIVATPSGGRHVWLRAPCEFSGDGLPGNRKLARGKQGVRIETRGLGGYALIPPTDGYRYERGNLLTLTEISADDFDTIITLSRSFDELTETETATYRPLARERVSGSRETPGEWFNRIRDWRSLLEPTGARWLRRVGRRDHYVRPGKTARTTSATTGNGGDKDLLKIHSSNWPGLPVDNVLDKFGFFVRTQHGGDFSAAARAIAQDPAYRRDNPPEASAADDYVDPSLVPGSGVAPSLIRSLGDGEEDPASEPVDDRPVISVANRGLQGPVSEFCDALDAAQAGISEPYAYVRGGQPVRVIQDESGRLSISPYATDSARGLMDRLCIWQRETDAGRKRFCPPPKDHVHDWLSLGHYPTLPKLEGVSASPLLSAGGVRLDRGYDPASGYFTHGPPTEAFSGTAKDAARFLIDDVLGDFPFDSDASTAHALCVMLAPLLRDAIKGPTPLYLFEAPTQGTGKSLCATTCLYPALGETDISSAPTNEEEWKKMITSNLARGVPAIFLDNLVGRLTSPSLAGVLTSTTWKDRLLGTNDIPSLSNKAIWVATGNNCELTGDFPRRVCLIRLDAKIENPEEGREFRHNLTTWLPANKARILGALVAIVRSWHDAGRPPGSRVLGSYESWSRVMSGILEHAGVPGFLGNREEMKARGDTEGLLWRGLFEAWWDYHDKPGAQWTAAQLVPLLENTEAYAALLGAAKPETRAISLGRFLRKRVGRVYGDWRLLLGTPIHGVQRYSLSLATGGVTGGVNSSQTANPTLGAPLFEPDDGVGWVSGVNPPTTHVHTRAHDHVYSPLYNPTNPTNPTEGMDSGSNGTEKMGGVSEFRENPNPTCNINPVQEEIL